MSEITDSLLDPLGQYSDSALIDDETVFSYFKLNEMYFQIEESVLNQLVPLRLLKNVPFRYLIPHEDLLPNESIRFFFVDRNWLDALVDGALSVGRIGTREYAYDERKYDSIMANLHSLEMEDRKIPGWANWREDTTEKQPPKMVDTGGTITGFLLRSRAVRDWPSMRIMAYKESQGKSFNWNISDRILTIRQERISDTVMLCLFNGTPSHIRIEEPRECLQLGVDAPVKKTTSDMAPAYETDEYGTASPTNSGAQGITYTDASKIILRWDDGTELSEISSMKDAIKEAFADVDVDEYPVSVRNMDNSVIDFRDMHVSLKSYFDSLLNGLGMPSKDFDSARLSLQFMQFPYQQDFIPKDELEVD